MGKWKEGRPSPWAYFLGSQTFHAVDGLLRLIKSNLTSVMLTYDERLASHNNGTHTGAHSEACSSDKLPRALQLPELTLLPTKPGDIGFEAE
jgi:hypothetical protein